MTPPQEPTGILQRPLCSAPRQKPRGVEGAIQEAPCTGSRRQTRWDAAGRRHPIRQRQQESHPLQPLEGCPVHKAHADGRRCQEHMQGGQHSGKLVGQKQETCLNLGFIFIFLVVAMLQMAQFTLFPVTIFSTYFVGTSTSNLHNSCKIFDKTAQTVTHLSAIFGHGIYFLASKIYGILRECLCFVPFLAIYVGLTIKINCWCFILPCIYWIKYTLIFLSHVDRTLREIILDPAWKQPRSPYAKDYVATRARLEDIQYHHKNQLIC